ncbi:unnamed protein product [Meganyctiphanes norvegica]|uniref:HEAT repeat-containing protein 1 n=1 Tax=Meganyctiphanes norvegica TaxID=48144 RepID=A0AAV2PUD9_MEGNR
MTTSLAAQLQKLSAPQTSILNEKKKRASILFDASKAEEYDRDVYFKIGQTGFSELLEVNKDFGKFQEALFGKKTRDQQRAVETKEVNLQLDANIDGFLLLISPYLEKESSLKALEWLVHRFLINEMNADALLMCIFPYYESSLFIRILQIISIKDERHRWHWLYGAQKTGRPVTKQTVGTRWANDQSFRRYVADYLSKMQKIHKSEGNFKIAINFYVTTVVGGLQLTNKIKEDHVTYLVQSIPKCLSSPHTELIAGMYFILAQLAVKIKLSQDILHSLLGKMVSNASLNLSEQCIMCLVALCHHQDIEAFNEEVVLALEGPAAFIMKDLQGVAKTFSVAPFVSAYLHGYLKWLLSEGCTLKDKKIITKLKEIMSRIENLSFSISDGTNIIKSMINLFAQNIENMKIFKTSDLIEIVSSFEKSHPEAYDAAVGQVMKNIDTITDKQLVKNYMSVIKDVLQSSTDSGNLFLRLMQPNDSLRTASVKDFAEKVKGGKIGDKEMILGHVKCMLNDDVSEIVGTALNLLGSPVRMEEKQLILEMEKLLQKSHKESDSGWGKLRAKIIKVLTKITNKEFQLRILYICLPYLLFPHMSKGSQSIKVILQSPLATQQPILTAISLELSPLIANNEMNNNKQFQTEIWKVLPKVLREMSNDEKNQLWGYVENQLISTYKKELLPHFLSMVILQQGLNSGGLDTSVQLRLAHKLADACVEGISEIGVSTNESDDILESKELDWGSYLQKVKEGNIPTGFLYLCLQQVISTFKLPQVCRQTPFWEPHMEGSGNDGYLLLLLKVLKGAILLESQGNIGTQMRDKLVFTILKSCLGSLENQFYFLAMVWGWQPYLPGSSIIDEILQVWCLNFGASYIESKSSNLAWALGSDKPIVPGLVSALSSNSTRVRSTAIECARNLVSVKGGSLLKKNQRVLLETLVNEAEEILADVSHIPVCVGKVDNGKSDSLSEIAKSLLNVILNESTPMHIRSILLYAISHIMHPNILVRCLPMSGNLLTKASTTTMDRMLDPATSLALYWLVHRFTMSPKALDTKEGWAVLLQALSCSKEVLDVDNKNLSPQGILMDEMSNLLRGISCGEVQAQLWMILISHVVESDDSREAAQLKRGLRKVNLDAQLIIQEINKLQLVDKVTSIREARAKRDKIRSEEGSGTQLLAWRKLEMMLETMGVMGGLQRPWLLVGPLCECLGRTFTLNIVITDLVQQQILSTLLHLINKTQEELGDNIADKIRLNVELIVQCIRFSVSTDTHRRALLILALAANIFPNIVMHNMMPIFTFMGTSSLFRRDDSYSFQVIHQTIKSIVPTLIKCETGHNELLGKLAQVCQVFVDALPDLPEHRRLPLFTQLATTFKTKDHLWIILTLLADSYVMKGSTPDDTSPDTASLIAPSVKGDEEEKRRLPKTIEFIHTLTSEFPVVSQLQSVLNLLKYVRGLPMEKDPKDVLFSKKGSNIPKIIIWDDHTPSKVRYFKYVCVSVQINILSSSMFMHRIFEANDEDELHLKALYKELLDNILQYTTDVSKVAEENKNKPVGNFWTSLQRKLVDLLDCIISLLPPPMLIEVVGGLIKSPLPVVRCKAMEILCSKMQPSANFFTEVDIKGLINFLDVLKQVGMKESETEENRQTALFALQLLTKMCAPMVEPSVLKPILDGAVQLVATDGLALRVLTSALLVVAEAVVVLKAHCVTHIKKLLPKLLRLLHGEIKADSEHLLLAAVTASHKLLVYVPQFLSPYMIKMICGICQLSAANEIASSKNKESHLENRLNGIKDMMVKNIEPRILIPNFKECYQILSVDKAESLPTLMMLVESLVGHIEGKVLSNHKAQFLELFKETFDLRAQKGSTKIIYKLEDCVNAALSRFMLRLNEKDNISIFFSLQHWAVEATEENPLRLITFYRFALHLAGTLKVLFIKAKLADKLYTHAASLLERNNSLNHEDTIFGSSDGGNESAVELVNVVLDTLTKVFLYDSVGFTNQERFNLMVKPLVDQLENCMGGDMAYENRISNHFIPCVIKFTVAVGDDSLWKDLNRQILLRVRNDDQPKVILGALSTFENLVDSQGEDYLQPLLADTMPYISEVLESLDSDVEEKTRNIFTKMEAILGDNLRAYLDR